jgi:Glyoxalase superfamily protein/Clp amino terminal domain, pathogenicity island component
LTEIRIGIILSQGRYDLLLAPFGDSERITTFVALCPNERVSNASVWHFCLVQAKDEDMRDFRNAKAMAQTLRAGLAAKSVKISVSQSLELVSEMLGVADWNTLAAIIRSDKSASPETASTAALAAGEGNPSPPVSADLTATTERAIRFAIQRNHQYATLEHLLLSLIEDADAFDAMRIYNADFAVLKGKLVRHLDYKLGIQVIESGRDPKPSAPFQRVFERARHRALELAHSTITGENILEAILFETETPAAWFLAEQGITRQFFALIPHARRWDRLFKRRPKDSP